MAKINRIENRQTGPMKIGFHRKKKVQRGNFVVQDEYFQKAKKAGYRARSIYKLLEIQQRFGLIKPDFSVIDIGAAPGSFLQAIRNIVSKDNLIVGVDLKEIIPLNYPNVKTIVCDIFDYEKLTNELNKILPENHIFDIITSDIAPNTTGVFDVDQYASVELNIAICEFSDKFLKKGGDMILKVFVGEDFNDLVMQVKKRFLNMKTYKPMACRDSSHEEYIICLSKK
ncbi:MAG: RlmE family RNA methyltransferase [Candidatus Gracilibacteria bacterium]|nr:RlmE family RNA methyltransferase [Candidatus Gracilibacteria bacterium]